MLCDDSDMGTFWCLSSRMTAAAAFLPELACGDFSLKVLSFWGSGPLLSCHHLLGKQSGHALTLLLEFNFVPSLSFGSHLAFPAHQGHLFSLLTLGFTACFFRRSWKGPDQVPPLFLSVCLSCLNLPFLSFLESPASSSSTAETFCSWEAQHLCLIWNKIFEEAGIPVQGPEGQGCARTT